MAMETLRHLRDDNDDDIPEQKAYGNFKVQRKWWQKLVFGLEDAAQEGLIPDTLKAEVDGFIKHYTSEEFHKQPLTTAEDVGRANGLINKIIGPQK
jgi:hypothetical protein